MKIKGKRLLFITGTRADFGKIEPLAKIAYEYDFHISFFITGMHMMKRYGETNIEVRRFDGATFFEFVNQREGDKLDFILSKTILGLSDFLYEHRPDLVIIHGDRIEALAASIVCALNYIPSAHIEGGEISGTIDESIRHSNSKLCASHFVSSHEAKRRVLALGENEKRVYVIGSPELDIHAKSSGVSLDEVKQRYTIPFNEYGVVVFHPVTSEIETIGKQAKYLFDALEDSGKNFVVIAPNNDPGTEDIFERLDELQEERFRIIPSMRFKYFSELMKNCKVMIGNSSAGVREAPFLGVPSLNVGTRQNGRTSVESVVHCAAHNKSKIVDFVLTNWSVRVESNHEFGDGSSRDKFLSVIQDKEFWKFDKQKYYCDMK